MRLVFEQGPRAGQVIPLEGEALTLGRGRETDLTLPVEGISRQHARLQRGSQGWVLVDLGSTNGTFVNGQRLQPEQPYLLRPGDQVAIGSLVLGVEGEVAPTASPAPDWDEAAGPAAEPPARSRPVLMIVGAVALIAVLAGIVLLIVTLLRPKPGARHANRGRPDGTDHDQPAGAHRVRGHHGYHHAGAALRAALLPIGGDGHADAGGGLAWAGIGEPTTGQRAGVRTRPQYERR